MLELREDQVFATHEFLKLGKVGRKLNLDVKKPSLPDVTWSSRLLSKLMMYNVQYGQFGGLVLLYCLSLFLSSSLFFDV